MKYLQPLAAIVAAVLFSAPPISASACPDKSYVRQYDDKRRTMSASYWVYELTGDDSDTLYQKLRKADALETYNRISREREPDFQCTFTADGNKCTNTAGYSWSPLIERYVDDGGESAYVIENNGDPSLRRCNYTEGCGVFVDKVGTRFMTERIFWRIYTDVHNGVYIPDVYTASVLKDGTQDLTVEAIVLRKLFSGGEKRHYVAISREMVTGFYCTYQERVFPKL